MKKSLLLLLTFLYLPLSYSQEEMTELDIIKMNLIDLNGKYNYDEDVFKVPVIENRFKKLVTEEVFEEMLECLVVVTPYRIKNDLFFFSGHSKTTFNGCKIVIDMKNDVFHAVIIYDNQEEKVFSEDMELYYKLPGFVN